LRLKVGVLALQGAVAPHIEMLNVIGCDAVCVRRPSDLDGISALVLPGGESTAMRRLVDSSSLQQPVMGRAAQGMPILGTCAGLILLAKYHGQVNPAFPLIDMTVERNAFNHRVDVFAASISVPMLGEEPVRALFVRGPVIKEVGDDVHVMARLESGEIVGVRQGNAIATAFHPELTGESRFHSLMAELASQVSDGTQTP
jgi:5'-phosphate synthase pdxT subunit